MPETVTISEEEHAYLLQQREASLRRIEADKDNIKALNKSIEAETIRARSIEKKLGLSGTRKEQRAVLQSIASQR